MRIMPVLHKLGKSIGMVIPAFLALVLLSCQSPPEPGLSSEFDISPLDVSPVTASIEEPIMVSAQIMNRGNIEGAYTAVLTLNGEELASREVVLPPQSSNIVTFNLKIDEIGTYNVAVNDSSKTIMITPLYVMKGVDINIPQEDFIKMKYAGISILTTEWGMNKSVAEARAFLDKAYAAGLKVVMDGGFSWAAWGFAESDWYVLPAGKRPVWQKEKVQQWVEALKNHPAVFGWDISNEAGMNFPSGARARNSKWPDTAVTINQLKQARADILEIDPEKPIMLRMAPWDLTQPSFQIDNPFEAGLADIVMLNMYSNYAPTGNATDPNIVQEKGPGYISEIKSNDPNAKIWVAVAAFKEPGYFQRTATNDLVRDIKSAMNLPHVSSLGFFAWGPIDFGRDDAWYLPEDGADLYNVIQYYMQTGQVPGQIPPDPIPKVVDVQFFPSEVKLGSYAEITVEVKNDGSSASWQTIAVSFPQNPADISIVGHNLSSADIYLPGYIGWRDYGTAEDCKFEYPLVEGVKSYWSSGETCYLKIKVKPETVGEFEFYVKSVAGRQSDGECISWDPATGEKDQQGEYVYKESINVLR